MRCSKGEHIFTRVREIEEGKCRSEMMQVYIANTDFLQEEKSFAHYYSLVNPERTRKVDRMRFQRDKELSLLAGLVLREGLMRNGIPYETVEVSYGMYGKPYIKGRKEQLQFNLSHSGTHVMGIFDRAPVGCDVQLAVIRETSPQQKLAKRFFHAEEYDAILSLKEERVRQQLFYRIWTLKESFLKACGMGMKLELNSFSVMDVIRAAEQINPMADAGNAQPKAEGVPLVNPVTEERFYLREYTGNDGYCYACAGRRNAFPADFKLLEFSKISAQRLRS